MKRHIMPIGGGSPRLEELEARQAEISRELEELHRTAGDDALGEDALNRWNEITGEFDRNETELTGLRERIARIKAAARYPANGERGDDAPPELENRDDVYDLSSIRVSPFAGEGELAQELRERALRAVQAADAPAETRDRVVDLLDRFRSRPKNLSALAERILRTGSPGYERAFGKYVTGIELSVEERAALAIGADATGGFAVPYVLDPTVISTKDYGVSPVRAISNVITIATKEWRGVSSAGVTASYAAEAAEAGDNAPTLAGPSITPERAHAFVPFSYEVDQDWGALRDEMARMFAEAKDDLEATKFILGAGSGSDEPMGVLAALTTTQRVLTASAATFALADVYSLDDAVPTRFRGRSSVLGDAVIFSKIRQFDTAGGAGLWERIGNAMPPQLLGHAAYEASAMVATTTTGSKILLAGDFSRYHIVDRIGMSVELLPHLLGSNRRPTGQRGLYAFWRNSADVVDDNAFRYLEVQ